MVSMGCRSMRSPAGGVNRDPAGGALPDVEKPSDPCYEDSSLLPGLRR